MNSSEKSCLAPGTVLHSPSGHEYVIEDIIGHGGFGITYSAWTDAEDEDIVGKVRVCIKELFLEEYCVRDAVTNQVRGPETQKGITLLQGALDDFRAEARRLIELSPKSDNIVHVWEVFDANGTAYYAMDFLRGQSLEQVRKMGSLDGYGTEDEKLISSLHPNLPESDIIMIIKPIVEAVAVLHKERFTHLDIKPANIMLCKSKHGIKPVLIDFGLSKHYNSDGSATSSINIKGCSNGYSPIEQYGGITMFSPTADVYSLGATIFALASGEVPPQSLNWPEDERNKAIETLPVSANLKAVLRNTLAPAPHLRYKDASSLLRALCKSDDIIVSSPPPIPQIEVLNDSSIDATKAVVGSDSIEENPDGKSADEQKPESHTMSRLTRFCVLFGITILLLTLLAPLFLILFS